MSRGVHVTTGASPIALRFPGQWYQAESGLHQNWHRDYDPTTGRYIQPDPLGLIDGASLYGYARQSPMRYTDPEGLQSLASNPRVITVLIGACAADGPLPIGDVLALTALGAIVVYEWASEQDCLTCGPNESRVGGSGKPRRHIVKHPTRKKAQDAAQADSTKGTQPEKHSNPTKGDPHYHPGGKKHRTHHAYPGGGYPKNKPY